MKRTIAIWFLFILAIYGHAQSGNGPRLNLHLRNASFTELARIIEKETSYPVYYQPEWFLGMTISVQADSEDVLELLKRVINNESFHLYYWQKSIVILHQKNLLSQLPNYNKSKSKETDNNKPETAHTAFMKGRKADVINIKVGHAKYPVIGREIKIKGQIVQADNQQPVEGATVYLNELQKGVVSDNQGCFEWQIPSGKYRVTFKCLGMQEINGQLEVVSDGSFLLEMQKANIDMKEVVIYGDKQMSIREKDPGMEKVAVKAIKALPMMAGESDILKVSELLPGVVSVGEGAAGLNVRGGSFDQNAFYFNRIPIYNTSHLFGFFPAFNADVVSDFSIYKGYIPAEYGGRLSSIFDIRTRTGNKKHYTAHGGISPLAANLTIEGPLLKDTASMMLSARSSYSDWILKRIKDYHIRTSKASFSDFTFSLNYDLPRTQISLFSYYSQDYFKLSDINTYWYSNMGASLAVGHQFSSAFRGDFSLSAVNYSFKTIDQQMASNAYEQSFGVNHDELKANFQRIFSERHSLGFGLNATLYQIDRGNINPYGDQSVRMPLDMGKERGLETAIYMSDNFDITPLLHLSSGFRFSAYSPFGPKDVYLYYPDGPKDIRYISDTLSFGSGQALRWYFFPEFRFSLNYQTDEMGNIKLAFNQMHQNIFMLNNTITVAPNSQWKLSDYHLQAGRSYQLSLGVFRNLPKGGWETSVEIYYKHTNHYTEFKDGADFLSTPLVETTVLQGEQKSYGLEFLIKRKGHRIDGWLAYTYSRSLVKVDGGQKWNQINNGNIYPSNFDIPHVFNAIINYHISKRVNFSTTLTYQTGKPATFPTSFYYVEGIPFVDYSKRNEYRIPAYFRADISLTIQGNLRKKKLLHSSFMFSVYNLTGRENPYSVYFVRENGRIKSYQYAVIGMPIFTATWIFKLGNYDAD